MAKESLKSRRSRKSVKVNINANRLLPDVFFEAFVELKFYLFKGTSFYTDEQQWMLYESCPEEGSKVKKKLATFKTEEEANAALKEVKQKLSKYLNENFKCQPVTKTQTHSRGLS